MHIVMTGATSGFGQNAAERLIVDNAHTFTIGTRNPDEAPELMRLDEVSFRALDLADLKSVRTFAATIEGPIDALVLNAGLQVSSKERAANGMEKTFVANHLGHFLLLDLLRPKLADNARVVITSSGTHDPDEKTGVPAPVHADADRLAFPETDDTLPDSGTKAGMRAYSSSKLLNVMTAMELQRRDPNLTALSFDPAFVPETGLIRHGSTPFRMFVRTIVPLMVPKGRKSTVPTSGRLLRDLVTQTRFATDDGVYWSVRDGRLENVAPSALARDDRARAQMWEDSERLAGISS